MKKGENYTDIVNKEVFGYLKDKFVEMLSFKKGELSKKKKILNKLKKFNQLKIIKIK